MRKISNIIYIPLLLILVMSCQKSGDHNTDNINEQDQKSSVEKENMKPTSKIYEMRTYYAAEGKLENLLARFRNNTTTIFEKHGMVNIGYWVPDENSENKLIYILGYESREQREAAWKAFGDDQDWKKVKIESERNGKLVDSVKRVFLKTTDYSPEIVLEDMGPRVFELRTYYTNEGKLDNLHARFRDHTMAIFENNGMTNIVYFSLDEDQEGSENTLVYLITHESEETSKKNWEAFSNDPDWTAAYKASISEGNLVNNLTSVFMKSTDFSNLK